MPAGSVRLPELRQDIKVDTKDLLRAEAAARRFKQSMNRNLQIDDDQLDRSMSNVEKKLDEFAKKNRQIKLDLDLDTAKAREKLKQIRNEDVKVKVDADTAKALAKIKRLAQQTVRVAVDATTTRAAAAIRRLGRERVQVSVDGDTTRARAKMEVLAKTVIRPSIDPKTAEAAAKIRTLSAIQLRPKVDPNLAGAAAKIRSLSAITIKPRVSPDMRGFRRSILDFAKNITVKLKVDLAATKAEIAKLDGTKITINVDADTLLARRKIAALRGETVRVYVDVDTDDAIRKINELSRTARSAARHIDGASRGLGGMSRNARLAARALGALSIAGVVGGAIGVLGAGTIAAAGALHSAAPAALALTGALGGLGVAAGGLVAIFKSNEGLKGSSEILRSAFQGIQDDLQRRVNPSILDFMRSVAGLAPIAREMVPPFAQAFNEVTQGFSRMLRDSTFQDDLRQVTRDGITQFRLFGEGGRNAIQGIMSLAAATGPFINRLAEGFVNVTAEFRNWVAEARKTGELNFLLENSFNILQSLGRVVRDLAVGFKQMFMAANFTGFTQTVLETLEGIAADFRRFTRERAADVAAMFANLRGQFAGFRDLIGSLADGIRIILTNIDLTPLMRGIQAIVPELASALTEFTNALARIGEQAAPAINSLLSLIRAVLPDIERVVTVTVQNITQVVNAVRPGVERLTEMLANIGDNVIPVIAGAARNLATAFSALMPIIAPIGEGIGFIVGLLGDMSGVAGIALAAMLGFGALRGIFGGAAQGAQRFSTWLNNVATGASNAGRNADGTAKRVGLLRGAMEGVARPFAQATIGARNFGTSLARIGEQMRVQRALAQQSGQAYGRLSGALTALQNTSSGVLRAFGAMGQAVVDGSRTMTNFRLAAMTAAEAVTRGVVTGMARPVAASLRGVGSALDSAGTRFYNFSGGAVGAMGSVTRAIGQGLNTAGRMFTGLADQVTRVAGSISNTLGRAASVGAGAVGRLGQVAGSAVSGGFTLLSRGVSGLTSALGGLSGIAITGVIVALTAMGQRSQEAARYQKSLQDAIGQAGGQIDANVTSMVRANLETKNLATGAESLGVSMEDITRAAIDGGAGMEDLATRLEEGSNVLARHVPWYAELTANLGSTSSANAELADAVRSTSEDIKAQQAAFQAQQDTLARNNDALGQGRQASIDLGEAMRTLASDTASAEDRAKALTSAMDIFRGGTEDAQDAAQKLNDSLRDNAPIEGFNQSMVTASGSIDTFTEAGSTMRSRLTEIRDAALGSAQAAYDNAAKTGDLGAATRAAAGEITRAEGEVRKMLQQYGLAPDVIDRVIKQMGLVPEEVNSTLNLENAQVVEQQLTQIKNQIDQVPNQKPINIDVPLAPQTIDKLKSIGVQVREIPGTNGQPARIELTVPDDRVRNEIPKIIGQIENPTGGSGPGGQPAMPATVDTDPMTPGIQEGREKIENPQGGPPKMPAEVDTDPMKPGVQTGREMVEQPQGGPPKMPTEVDLDPFRPGVQTAQDMITAPQGGNPAMPIGGNFGPLEQAYDARLAIVQGDQRWKVNISANFTQIEGEYDRLLGIVQSDQRWKVNITGNFQQLQTEYDRLLGIATSDGRWIVRVSGNFDMLRTMYDQLLAIATSDPRWVVPVSGDFSALQAEYDRWVQIISTTPVVIPIYGQFMGIQGLPGMGGFGMASGGILENEKGRIVEYFADGGMSTADRMALKANAGTEQKYPNSTALDGMATAKGMGLKPMAANTASIVAPNTWRVIGDRAQDDESYIPINRSARSIQILSETASRMGFALEEFARGGFSNASPTAKPSSSDSDGTYTSPASSVVNNNDAPVVAGDLSIVVPRDTDVNDAMDEMLFQLRRISRGGVHRRTSAQMGR